MIKKFIQNFLQPSGIPKGLSPELEKLAKRYQKVRPGKTHSTFCHAPEVNMLFSQEGEVFVCCHNQTYPIGKYPEQSISEIWNSEPARELREKLRNYNLEGGCKICADDFKRGAFKEVRARHFDSLKPHDRYPVMMEFLLSNVCNLECVMCTGKFSSLIRKNREGLPPLPSPYRQSFLDQLDEFIPHLKETRFSGSGEAFSIDMNYEIWGKIIRMNPECLIMVQTNGTILSARVKEVMEKGNFQIGVSIDSLDKATYEAIRLNANFDKVMANLLYFKDYAHRKGTRFSISMCVMRQNWREVPDFIRFCNQMEAVATLHKVWHPFGNALFNLPKHELERIIEAYDSEDFSGNSTLQKENILHFQYFKEVVREWYLSSREGFFSNGYMNTVAEILENSSDYHLILQNINDYIKRVYKPDPAKYSQLQEDARMRLQALITLLEDIKIIDFALKKMSESPVHEIVDVVLYHDLEMLKEEVLKRFEATSGSY